MIFPRKTCSECRHWAFGEYATRISDAGFIEAVCKQPADERDRQHKRGSDYCSKWERAA